MNKADTPPGEEHQIRCPRLGHQIQFSYCRSENDGLPCPKVLDCWHHFFLVEAFLREELSEEEWEKVFMQPPKPKMVSLLELIEQAKQRKKDMS